MEIQIITTEDGSHTLFLPHLNETYHSTHGAVQESAYVYIQQGLQLLMPSENEIRILEVGFGTGLNAWLTALLPQKVHFTTLELFPLEEKIWKALNYADQQNLELFRKLHETDWEKECRIADHFTLLKKNVSLEKVDLSNFLFDLVYFDAFAPSKQPEIWSEDNFRKIANQLRKGGLLVTYCASGAFKRTLKALDFEVETLPGPPGKKEMTRAVKR